VIGAQWLHIAPTISISYVRGLSLTYTVEDKLPGHVTERVSTPCAPQPHTSERDLIHSTHAVSAEREYTTDTLSLVDLYLTLVALINNSDCVRTSHLDHSLYRRWVVGIVLVTKTVVVEERET
jgi:hypothetical protein